MGLVLWIHTPINHWKFFINKNRTTFDDSLFLKLPQGQKRIAILNKQDKYVWFICCLSQDYVKGCKAQLVFLYICACIFDNMWLINSTSGRDEFAQTICLSICRYLCACVYIHMHVCVCVCERVRVCVYVCVSTCADEIFSRWKEILMSKVSLVLCWFSVNRKFNMTTSYTTLLLISLEWYIFWCIHV